MSANAISGDVSNAAHQLTGSVAKRAGIMAALAAAGGMLGMGLARKKNGDDKEEKLYSDANIGNDPTASEFIEMNDMSSNQSVAPSVAPSVTFVPARSGLARGDQSVASYRSGVDLDGPILPSACRSPDNDSVACSAARSVGGSYRGINGGGASVAGSYAPSVSRSAAPSVGTRSAVGTASVTPSAGTRSAVGSSVAPSATAGSMARGGVAGSVAGSVAPSVNQSVARSYPSLEGSQAASVPASVSVAHGKGGKAVAFDEASYCESLDQSWM
jgi:hypothetical protein